MSLDERDVLDELLKRAYAPLRQPDAAGRAALLAKLPATVAAVLPGSHRRRPARLAVLAAAAAIAAVVLAKSFWLPSSDAVYGLETVGQRLRQVQTIRVRGSQFLYDSQNPAAPVRVPVEYLIKRPDKFRYHWYGATLGDGPPVIRRGWRICDGRREGTILEFDRKCLFAPIDPLDARAQTETFAQSFILDAVIGAPEAPYKLVDRERIGDRPCDIYEARTTTAFNEQSIVRLWFDPASGYPLRLVEDQVASDGVKRRTREYDEISVNIPVADEAFAFPAPEGYEIVETPAPAEGPALDMSPTSSGASSHAKLETWRALRIADNAAIVLWRRSEPPAAADGSHDWLSNLEVTLSSGQGDQGARHKVLYESKSPDRWNWSLVVARGALPERSWIDVTLRAESEHRVTLLILRLDNEKDLQEIIARAAEAAWSENETRPSLASLRAEARRLASEADKP